MQLITCANLCLLLNVLWMYGNTCKMNKCIIHFVVSTFYYLNNSHYISSYNDNLLQPYRLKFNKTILPPFVLSYLTKLGWKKTATLINSVSFKPTYVFLKYNGLFRFRRTIFINVCIKCCRHSMDTLSYEILLYTYFFDRNVVHITMICSATNRS